MDHSLCSDTMISVGTVVSLLLDLSNIQFRIDQTVSTLYYLPQSQVTVNRPNCTFKTFFGLFFCALGNKRTNEKETTAQT